MAPPPHEPDARPKWLGERNVNLIIADGTGNHAQQLSTQRNIDVVSGASTAASAEFVRAWMNGALRSGANVFDH